MQLNLSCTTNNNTGEITIIADGVELLTLNAPTDNDELASALTTAFNAGFEYQLTNDEESQKMILTFNPFDDSFVVSYIPELENRSSERFQAMGKVERSHLNTCEFIEARLKQLLNQKAVEILNLEAEQESPPKTKPAKKTKTKTKKVQPKK